MGITSNKIVAEHLEVLRSLLEFGSSDDAMKKRIEIIEQNLNEKADMDPQFTRAFFLKETAFMVKNKKKIIQAVGEDKYLDLFSLSVKFLEKHPEPRKNKEKTTTANYIKGMRLEMPSFTVSGNGTATLWNAAINFEEYVIGTQTGDTAVANTTAAAIVAGTTTDQAQNLANDALHRLISETEIILYGDGDPVSQTGDTVNEALVSAMDQIQHPEEGAEPNE